MSKKPVVGFIGIGMMGWGMAKNVVEKGFPLLVMAHRKREAVDDLVSRGAEEVSCAKAMAERADIVVLCVTGAAQVQSSLEGPDGLLANARAGLTIVDCSTSDPDLTLHLNESLAKRDITFIDAPLSKAPADAWKGELSTYISGPEALVERLRPLLSTWASTIIPVGGPAGSALSVKLINNLVTVGYVALWSECYAMIGKIGVKPDVFRQVISAAGLNCHNFQTFSKYICDGDPNTHKFTLSNCLKDLTYYNRLATQHNAMTLMSDGALQMMKLAKSMGYQDRFMTQLVDVVARLNGDSEEQAGGPAKS